MEHTKLQIVVQMRRKGNAIVPVRDDDIEITMWAYEMLFWYMILCSFVICQNLLFFFIFFSINLFTSRSLEPCNRIYLIDIFLELAYFYNKRHWVEKTIEKHTPTLYVMICSCLNLCVQKPEILGLLYLVWQLLKSCQIF